MPALDNFKTIFFLAGAIATAAETALINRLRGTVVVRNGAADVTYGGRLESADGLAGTIPASYKTGVGNTIDLALYPNGDVTPTAVAYPEAFKAIPATETLAVGATKRISFVSADLNETTGVITITDLTKAASVEWASSVVGKATVDTDGVVTGVQAGATNITATYTYADGSTVSATCALTVS